MKSLIAGIVLIVVLGVGGFFYRNVLEHRAGAGTGGASACTLEAKVCPDGSTVSRSGPNCAFAQCAYPNVALPDIRIAFAVPAGFSPDVQATGTDPSLVAAFSNGGDAPSDAIVVRDYPIPDGETAKDVILANTHLEPSDMSPSDMSKYTPKIVGIRTFSEITVERFEAVVHTDYFLPRSNDVLVFEVLEHNVTDWQNASLIPDNLPVHQALLKMLGTLEDDTPQPE